MEINVCVVFVECCLVLFVVPRLYYTKARGLWYLIMNIIISMYVDNLSAGADSVQRLQSLWKNGLLIVNSF